MNFEYIRWIDSSSLTDRVRHDVGEVPTNITYCESVGWVVAETDDVVTLAGHRDEQSGQVAGVMLIPVVSIAERYTIQV